MSEKIAQLNNDPKLNALMDALYEGLDPSGLNDTESKKHYQSLLSVKHISEKAVVDFEVPQHLTQLVLNRTTRQPSSHKGYWLSGLASMAAALVMVLTYQVYQSSNNSVNNVSSNNQSETALQETHELQLPQSGYPGMVRQNELIRPVSFGDTQDTIENNLALDNTVSVPELDPMVGESITDFQFHQALRLRAAGDYQATAELLGQILKSNPNYSRSRDVLTICIDAFFRMDNNYEALKLFAYLKTIDPDRAQILADRWLSNDQ